MTQSATVKLRAGNHTRLLARLEMTPAGLLAIGALVSSILLSSAVIVRVAGRR